AHQHLYARVMQKRGVSRYGHVEDAVLVEVAHGHGRGSQSVADGDWIRKRAVAVAKEHTNGSRVVHGEAAIYGHKIKAAIAVQVPGRQGIKVVAHAEVLNALERTVAVAQKHAYRAFVVCRHHVEDLVSGEVSHQ